MKFSPFLLRQGCGGQAGSKDGVVSFILRFAYRAASSAPAGMTAVLTVEMTVLEICLFMIKKNPGTLTVPGSAFNLLYQPHDGTALSGRSRRMFSVIRLIISFFIFIFTPFSCVYFSDITPVFLQVKVLKKFFIFFIFPA
ncbi:MAG: hypothetical protein IKC94_04185 [Lentisphaeria bacterium]|nr:hypothetical protein [Lentisphaeria bacterium]